MREFRNIWLLVLVLVSGIALGGPTSYVINPLLGDEEARIEVTLTLKADSEGNTTLIYFDEAWGEVSLYECLESIEVLNSYARVRKVPKQNRIYIKSAPHEELSIRYLLRQDFTGEPDEQLYYRPIINKDYFHLFGHRLFIIPEEIYKSEGAHDISISWTKKPFLVQHNFGISPEAIYSITRDELLESVIVGGDFRKESLTINGITLHLLTRGNWGQFRDEELAEKLESIVEVQREFWNDYTDDIYTVTLLPLETGESRYLGGTGLSKGFASYCSNSDESRLVDLTSLYYHEIMHHWIGGKIRNSTRTEELWFSEGFTEYFSYFLMWQEGELSTSQWRAKKKEVYRLHASSNLNTIHNDKVDFVEAEKVPYRRGFLYAMFLDQRLKEAGKEGLKEVMLHILADADERDFSNDYFQAVLGQCLGNEYITHFRKHILEGDLISKKELF